MGSATGRDLHVDNLLSQVAINYRPNGMIWDQIAPIVSVLKETDSYPVFNRGEVFAIENTNRSRGTEANRVTRSVSSAQYAAKNYALAYDLFLEDRANMDAAFQFELEAGGTRYTNDKLMLDADRRTLVLAVAGVSTTFLTGSAWNGATQGDPVSMIWRMQEQVKTVTAQKPNSLIFGWQAWNLARRNTNFRNFVQGTNNGGGNLTRDNIASAFEVDRLLVADGFYNPANEAQTATFSNYFPKDAVMAYFAPLNASREQPSFMYSFRWTNPVLGQPMAVVRHDFDTRKKVEGIELSYYQDEKVTGSEYGLIMTGVGSAQTNGLT